MTQNERILLFFKIAAGIFFVVVGIAIFKYPFPGLCAHCSFLYKSSYFIFSIFGITTFYLPVLGLLILLRRVGQVGKFLKLSLQLWVPVLLNVALLRELLEIESNIGGLFAWIFSFARDRDVDFLFVLIPIIGFDLLVLLLLGVDLPRLWSKLINKEEPEDAEDRQSE